MAHRPHTTASRRSQRGLATVVSKRRPRLWVSGSVPSGAAIAAPRGPLLRDVGEPVIMETVLGKGGWGRPGLIV